MTRTKSTFLALVAVLLSPMAANADVITSGSVYNNTAGEYSAAYNVGLLSDQSGLSSAYVDGVTDFATYTSSGVTHATSEGGGGVTWLSNGVPNFPVFMDFDLGAALQILNLALWNGTAGNTASINGFSIFTSMVADFSVSTFAGAFNNPIGVNGPEPVTIFDLTDTTGQYVRVQLDSYYGNGCCAGIGEIAWDVAAVPEPGTLALFGIGLLGMGLSRRRKKA